MSEVHLYWREREKKREKERERQEWMEGERVRKRESALVPSLISPLWRFPPTHLSLVLSLRLFGLTNVVKPGSFPL